VNTLYQKTGKYQLTPYTGRKSKLSKEQDQKIKDTITKTPDITLIELNEELYLNLTKGGLSIHLKKMGYHINFIKRVFMEDCTIGDMPMLEEPRKPKNVFMGSAMEKPF